MTLGVCIESAVSTAQALSRGSALAQTVGQTAPGQPGTAVLYAAELTGPATVLGAYQHVEHALADTRAAAHGELLRRNTGGVTVRAGDGLLYASLLLHGAGTLIACPPGKLLNRCVRGTLAGLRSLGLPAHYFGRDFVSLDAHPVAYIGWTEEASGFVQIELFLALDKPFALDPESSGYPAPSEPPFRGRPLTTLRASLGRDHGELTARAVLEALAQGHARAFGVELHAFDLDLRQLEHAATLEPAMRTISEPSGLHWAAPRPEAIGFVSAGVSLDEAGLLADVRVGGDFFMHRACNPQLADALTGKPPTSDVFATALDEVLAHRVGLIEGVRSLRTLHAALEEAAERART